MGARASRFVRVGAIGILALCAAPGALAQFNENCTVSVLNRNVRVNPDLSWVLPNVPANFGSVRARVTCIVDGQTISGESDLFTVPPNGVVNLPHIVFGQTTPIPTSLMLTAPTHTLTQVGATVQLAVSARYPDGTIKDVTLASTGTQYTISNAAIATVSSDGLVQAVQSGTVLIQATQEGASGLSSVQVVLGGASHGGIPDSWAIANGLDPNDPVMPSEDPDRDGLTNLQEFQLGTDPHNPDTDGDGLTDGDEVNLYHTSPLLADTDGDRIPDGVEVRTGTDPLNSNSYDLATATASSVLRPPSFRLSTSPLSLSASQQLSWSVNLIDGKTSLDLTQDPRTNYSSSDLLVCNFGLERGVVFAGSPGSCVITISQNTLSVTVPGTIQSFTPTEVSSIGINGAVAVDVAGTFAYVAAASNGLVVVDVSDATRPRLRGVLPGIGDAEGIRVSGQHVLVTDANGALRVVNVIDPDAPTLVASLPIAGRPVALAVHGNLAAVAAQVGGVSFVNITDPAAPILIATLAVPGPALGVDFDAQRGLAAVAMGSSGLQLVDISTPTLPQLRGLLPGGDVRRVLLKSPAALLADVQRSVTAVDVTDPDQPVLSSSIPANLGGAPVDIAAFGAVAMTADVSFGRAIPVISVSNPLQPNTVLFWSPGAAGFSSSIAVDARFGYLIMPSTLRIFQYRDVVDTAGIPPTIQITSPANGAQAIHATTLTVTAAATDDVAVAQVSFLVDGQTAFSTTAAPYQYTLTMPDSGSTLILGATAVDFGNNTGTAANVTLNLIPDPLTTVVGTVFYAGLPVAGATVTCLGESGMTGADGTFAVASIPTLRPVVCVAETVIDGTLLAGSSMPVTAVRGGTTSIGSILIGPFPIITSLSRRSALFHTVVNVTVTGASLAGATFSFHTSAISVTSVSVNTGGTVANLTLSVGTSAGTFALVATTAFGSSPSGVMAINRFTVVDPNSTADSDGDGFVDVIEAAFGSDPLDPTNVPKPNLPSSGEVDAQVVSVLNSAGGVPGQPATQEADAPSFSVLNSAGVAPGQPAAHEADSPAFSVLNRAGAGGGQPIRMEASGLVFSVLNAAGVAPGQPAAHEAGATAFSVLNIANVTGGTPVGMEANAAPFSVLNTAETTPSGRPVPMEADATSTSVFNLAGVPQATITVLPESSPTLLIGTTGYGTAVSRSSDPLGPFQDLSVWYAGYQVGGSSETLIGYSSGGGAAVLRVLDENRNVLASLSTSGQPCCTVSPYTLPLSGVSGQTFFIDEFDYSANGRYRDHIAVSYRAR